MLRSEHHLSGSSLIDVTLEPLIAEAATLLKQRVVQREAKSDSHVMGPSLASRVLGAERV